MSKDICPKCGTLMWVNVAGTALRHLIGDRECLHKQLNQRDAAIKVKDEALKAAKKLALQHEEISADYVLMEIEEALAAGRSKT